MGEEGQKHGFQILGSGWKARVKEVRKAGTGDCGQGEVSIRELVSCTHRFPKWLPTCVEISGMHEIVGQKMRLLLRVKFDDTCENAFYTVNCRTHVKYCSS